MSGLLSSAHLDVSPGLYSRHLGSVINMSDSNQEIKDLILALDKKLDGFDRKFENQITELKNEVRLVKTELQAEIGLARTELEAKIDLTRNELEAKINLTRNELEAKIDLSRKELEAKIDLSRTELEAKISLAQTGLEGKIAELSGKMDGYGKRLEQQEFVSRGAIVALVVGVVSGFIKYLFFSS
ncbi:hypothetical protein [Thermostichus vulcanus]|uniref:Uncharacterized protein n=1 Tax=Thermostichus vulcanus str. 'Rupite' TaxID=2813851 RepID=A0ABT0CCH6_THEVL|nr:hypothetical protein [Thermostichus vulcanus]MCJ2543040.1 hypothetical protein [Thermostichus vulcanus str. 'Rupite']